MIFAGGDVRIPIDESPNTAVECEERGSKSAEVVKSIVYGGLTELITSLSVVSSAAASGATTRK